MKVLLVCLSHVPPKCYGGTERDVWWLAKALSNLGHSVRILALSARENQFSETIRYNKRLPLEQQIDDWPDVVHFHSPFNGPLHRPFLVTVHGNGKRGERFPLNSVFISRSHAEKHGSDTWVHNGIDLDDYGSPDLSGKGDYFHFLGKAAWRVKNIRGAIKISRMANVPLKVMGGYRVDFNMGFRFTTDRHVSFHGMVAGEEKNALIRGSRGLIYPVQWHEPFGLAIIESLYLGNPVFGTPFGSLPELVNEDVGFLSTNYSELAQAVKGAASFNRSVCHEYAAENFNSEKNAIDYLKLYEKVVAGENLNQTEPVARDVEFTGLKLYD